MDWDGIVNSTPNTVFRQEPHDMIPLLNADRVDVINVPDAGCLDRCNDFSDAVQCPVIICRVRSPKLISSFKMAQFDAQNGCLDSVHPTVPTDHGVVIFEDLAVVPKDPDLLPQLGVIRHNCARFSESSQVLPGIKAKTGRVTKRAHP